MTPDLKELQSTLPALARESAWGPFIHNARIVPECASTQDEARHAAQELSGVPGLLIVAGRQTAGRGRLGRAWIDTQGLGVAATYVLDAGPGAPYLSLAAGLAAHRAAQLAVPEGGPRLGLRWPNDVVEHLVPGDAGTAHATSGRKLAGVLVEVSGPLAYVGIGINVGQQSNDWPPHLGHLAVSLRQMGSDWTRTQVIDTLSSMLGMYLTRPAFELAQSWKQRDTLVGTVRTFEHDTQRYSGTVVDIDPLARITLKTNSQQVVHLPALTTSLVHDDRLGVV